MIHEPATPTTGDVAQGPSAAELKARLETLEAALELPLMFFAGGPWDLAKQARWKALTGEDEATTRVMCDAIRRVLGLL